MTRNAVSLNYRMPETKGGFDFSGGEVQDVHSGASPVLEPSDYHYQSVNGRSDLLASIEKDRGIQNFDCRNSMCVTVGAKHGLNLAIRFVSRRTDTLIGPIPGWAPYRLLAEEYGLAFVGYDPLSFESLLRSIEVNPRSAIVLNYPNNPTGAPISPEHAAAVFEASHKARSWIVSDEVYRTLACDHPSFAHYALSTDRVIVVDSISKSHAAAGLRVGYVIAAPRIIDDFIDQIGISVSGTSSLSQLFAKSLLDNSDLSHQIRLNVAEHNLQFARFLDEANVSIVSSGGLYIWAKGEPTLHIDNLQIHGLPGQIFGAPGHVRFGPSSNPSALKDLLRL